MSERTFSPREILLELWGFAGKHLPSPQTLQGWSRRQEFFVIALLILVGAILSLCTSIFLTASNLSNIALYFSWIAIAAIGESLVILIGGIDLSVGAGMALAGLVSALCVRSGFSTPLAIIAGLLTGGVLGWINGSLVGRIKLPPFIATLGTMSIARGAAFGLTGGWPVRDLPESYLIYGQRYLELGSLRLPVATLIVLGFALMVFLLLRSTIMGRYIQTLGMSERALLLAGVNPTPLKILVYTLGGFLAAVAGLLMTSNLGVAAPTAAAGYELDIIAAAIIGGASLSGGQGSILGVLLGAVFLQVMRNGLVLLGFPVFWQPVAIGVLILGALIINYFRHYRAQSR
jgi:ribose transport system permease protein